MAQEWLPYLLTHPTLHVRIHKHVTFTLKLGHRLPRRPDDTYQEYYQKHIPLSSIKDANDAIRTRYAGIIQGGPDEGNITDTPTVSIDGIYFYSTGLAAVWNLS